MNVVRHARTPNEVNPYYDLIFAKCKKERPWNSRPHTFEKFRGNFFWGAKSNILGLSWGTFHYTKACLFVTKNAAENLIKSSFLQVHKLSILSDGHDEGSHNIFCYLLHSHSHLTILPIVFSLDWPFWFPKYMHLL